MRLFAHLLPLTVEPISSALRASKPDCNACKGVPLSDEAAFNIDSADVVGAAGVAKTSLPLSTNVEKNRRLVWINAWSDWKPW